MQDRSCSHLGQMTKDTDGNHQYECQGSFLRQSSFGEGGRDPWIQDPVAGHGELNQANFYPGPTGGGTDLRPRLPNMLLVGATGRKLGKTTLVCSLLKHFSSKQPLVGVKITTMDGRDHPCPHGRGCGVCEAFSDDFLVTEELPATGNKDTARMFESGASRVFWLRAQRGSLLQGLKKLLEIVGTSSSLVCESTSLADVISPGLFFMVRQFEEIASKMAADRVRDWVDRFVVFDGKAFDLNLADVNLVQGKWGLKENATALILAGGSSQRMGTNKSLLPINGKPNIENLIAHLSPHFRETLISTNEPWLYNSLGLRMIADRETGRGPLMGLVSGLAASNTDLNLAVACDIPFVVIPFVRRMLERASQADVVIPQSERGYETLFCVYRKTLIPFMEQVLSQGRGRIREAFADSRVRCALVPKPDWLCNINTPEEFEACTAKQTVKDFF